VLIVTPGPTDSTSPCDTPVCLCALLHGEKHSSQIWAVLLQHRGLLLADMGGHRQDGYSTEHSSADMDWLARWLDLLVPSLCGNSVWCCSPMIPPNPCFGVFDVGAHYYYNVGLFLSGAKHVA